MHNIYRDNLL